MRENLKTFSETYRDIKVETKYVANKHPILIAEYSNSPFQAIICREWSLTSSLREEYAN